MSQLEKFHKEGGSFLETFLSKDNPLLQLWKRTPLGWYLTQRK
jgi:hypothetical protein